MDALRGLAILLVVAFHSRTVLARFEPDVPDGLQSVLALFAPFRMPLLMFLSGMLLHRSLAKPAGEYADGKLRRLGWPYAVWSLLFLLVAGRLLPDEVVRLLWDAPPYLWYLSYLLAYYAAARALQAVRVPLSAAAGTSFLVAVLVDGGTTGRLFFLFVFFAAGDVYARSGVDVVPGRRGVWAWAAAAVVVPSALVSAAGVDLEYEPVFVWVPLAGIALCLALAPRLQGTRAVRPLAWAGRESMAVYVSHFGVLWLLHGRLGLGADLPATARYLLGLAGAVVAGGLLARLAQRHAAVRALFVLPDVRRRPAAARRVGGE